MLLILAAARHLTSFAEEMRGGAWAPRIATELQGRTLAVIGFGHIGRAVARIASDGFQMKVTSVGRRDDYRTAVRDATFELTREAVLRREDGTDRDVRAAQRIERAHPVTLAARSMRDQRDTLASERRVVLCA